MSIKEIHIQESPSQSLVDKHTPKSLSSHPTLVKMKELVRNNCVKAMSQIQKQPHEKKAIVVLGLGIAYFILGVFSIHFNLSMLMIFGSLGFIVIQKVKKAKKAGIINKVSPGLRTLLMNRSIFDVLCDLWYFPIIPKYVKAVLGPFIFKKDPEETVKNFDELHPKFKQLVLTKGVINVLPTFLKNFLLPDNILDINSDHILESEDAGLEGGQQVHGSYANLSTRDNSDTNSNTETQNNNIPYLKEKNLVHEAIEELNAGVIRGNANNNNNKDINLQPGSTEVVICSQDVQNQIKREKMLKQLQGNVESKYYKALHYHLIKENKEKHSTFSKDPRTFLFKFLRGSKNVSESDRKSIKKALFMASIILGTQLYFSKQSRQWLKYTLLFMVYFASVSVGAGSFVLLAKHSKASKKAATPITTQQEEI